MKLRSFSYLNTNIVKEYISMIDGYTYDEEAQSVATFSENSVSGKGGIPVISGSGNHIGRKEEEIRRSVKFERYAKFDKIYKFLQSDEDNNLKYYESLSSESYANLKRDEFLEVLVTPRFSKMREFTSGFMNLSEMAAVLEPVIGKPVLDGRTKEAMNSFSNLSKIKSSKGIACVFEFEDGKYPIVAHLDENYFECNQDNFVRREVYMLCKVIRKVPKGEKIKLDEIFEDVKKMPLNRSQRRNMPKNIGNPSEIRDEIKGPALVVLPIAVYY